MRVREDMLNGHDICHGGLIATLADSAFAYACNSYNELTVASGFMADFVAPAGIAVIALADVAGLVVMRTVACLANEAADVVTWTGTTAADIDTAMRLGTAYPVGPLAWADAIGVARVATVLANLQAHYGDARYRRAPRLAAANFEGARLAHG
jgi:3-hydroxybutyryl-CoA dehydrogenase